MAKVPFRSCSTPIPAVRTTGCRRPLLGLGAGLALQTIATVGPIVLKVYCFHDTTTNNTIIQLTAFSTGPQFNLDAFYENQTNGTGAYTTNSYDSPAPISQGGIDYFPVDSATTARTFIAPALISYATQSGEVVGTMEGVASVDGRPGTRSCSLVGSVTPVLAG